MGIDEHTWFSYARGGGPGRGFRIDHAFASAVLANRVRACGYDHVMRERRLSDHSALLVELADDAGGAPAIRLRRRFARGRFGALGARRRDALAADARSG